MTNEQILEIVRQAQGAWKSSPLVGRSDLLLNMVKVYLSKTGLDPAKSRDGLIQAAALILLILENEENKCYPA